MATYKKRGGKPKKTREEKIEQKSSIAKFFRKLDYGASVIQDWIARNRNPVFIVIGIVVVGALGYLAYDTFVVQPKQEEATKEISQPLSFYSQALQTEPGPDQDTLFIKSLNGSGGYGLLDIIDNYSGTDAANIAQYSAGISYLKLGEYEKAIEHLNKFSGKDEFFPAIAKGAIGDAYTENGQHKEALKYYEEAAKVRENKYTTPKYLLKAAITAINLEEFDKAENHLKRIKDEYDDSAEAEKASVYLGIAKHN